MALSNVKVRELCKEYKETAEAVKQAEDRKKALKEAILEEMGVRGVTILEAQEYTAILSTYEKESIGLKETLAEFGRDILEAKKLINKYPVETLKVTKK